MTQTDKRRLETWMTPLQTNSHTNRLKPARDVIPKMECISSSFSNRLLILERSRDFMIKDRSVKVPSSDVLWWRPLEIGRYCGGSLALHAPTKIHGLRFLNIFMRYSGYLSISRDIIAQVFIGHGFLYSFELIRGTQRCLNSPPPNPPSPSPPYSSGIRKNVLPECDELSPFSFVYLL